jgi:hypothetical protein
MLLVASRNGELHRRPPIPIITGSTVMSREIGEIGSMNEWNIQSRAHACQACGRHFADQQPYHTVLVDHRRDVQRLDLCAACWREGHADGASSRQGFVSQWQGTYEQPPAAPPDAIRKENAEGLLRKIIERNEPCYAAVGYILAAMLERKRLLKVKEQLKRDGRRVFVYEQPKTGDIFTITDPELQLNQLDQVQREVANLLEHGFPAETPSATPGRSETVATELPLTEIPASEVTGAGKQSTSADPEPAAAPESPSKPAEPVTREA